MTEPWPLRIYRMLLRAYPRRFHERFGDDMAADARALVASRRAAEGTRGVVSAVWLVARDLVRSALRERMESRRQRRRGPDAGRGGGMFVHQLRQALRTLLRAPGFTAATVATIGLGIGATTAIFSVLYAVVLRPLPFPEPERLVRIWELTPQGQDFSTSPPNVLDFRERSRALESIGAVAQTDLTWTGTGEPQQISVGRVTSNVFAMLGARATLGRLFTEEEERPGVDGRVLIISEGVWRSQFGGDADIVGRTLTLSGSAWTIVGVMAEGFDFPRGVQGWSPMPLDPAASRGDHRIAAIGKLRQGVAVEDAALELRTIAEALGREYPDSNGGWSTRIATFPEWIIGADLTNTILVLQLAAGLLLLLACANAAHLLLVRAVTRDREIGVRFALGASRRQVAEQLVAESLVLAALAGAAGVALAYAGVPVLMRMSPEGLPRADEVAVSSTVLLFASVVASISGLLSGLLPALHLARSDVATTLRVGARSASRRGRQVRELLLAGEVAFAAVLMVGAALLLASFARLRSTEIGFDSENVLAVPVTLTSRFYSGCPAGDGECSRSVGDDRLLAFMRDAVERLEALPGVRRVGATNITPLSGGGTGMEISVEGYTPESASDAPWADWRAVTTGFFDAAGLDIVSGRAITATEESQRAPVVVVSQSLARRYWPGVDPIGRRMAFGGSRENWLTVVGVARDMRDVELENGPRDVAFLSYSGVLWPYMTLLIRTDGNPEALAGEVRRTLWSIDPALPIPEVRALESIRSGALGGARFSLLLMGVFAATALVLGVLGVYGVTYFTVADRKRELGIRVALGADRTSVLALVLRGAVRPVLVGVVLGLAGAGAASRWIRALLYATDPVDVRLYAAAGTVLAAVAVAASLLPAWRAARVDPKQTLSEQ